MRRVPPTVRYHGRCRPIAIAAADDRHLLMRGLAHGIILSLGMWVAAGYLVFILR